MGAAGNPPPLAGKRLLLVEDDPGVRRGLRRFLTAKGCELLEAGTRAQGAELVASARPHLIVSDFVLPDGTALDLLRDLQQSGESVPLIVLTGHGTIERAVEALQLGAENFLTKPVNLGTLLSVIARAISVDRIRRHALLGQHTGASRSPDLFAGNSAAIRALAADAAKVAQVNSPVLIVGETGSGKGVLARWLHRQGPRRDEPFVELNCAGLTFELTDGELFGYQKGAFTSATASKPGLLEAADRGTLFLDEIADLDSRVQPKLLKAIEDKRFRRLGEIGERQADFRLLAASHRPLLELVEEGRFRRELFFRLNTLTLQVPALRERREDVPGLARALLAGIGQELGRPRLTLTAAAERQLSAYPWPGNVRELRNVLERAAILTAGEEIDAADLRLGDAASAPPDPGSPSALDLAERREIAQALQKEGGSVVRAAERLGIPRSTLYYKLRKHGLPSNS